MSDVSDEALVNRAQDGERDAFRQLVERYQRRLYAVAFGMLRNREDALDVVQDAFIKVHKHIDSFQGSSSFYTWAYRICSNLCIDLIRKRGRQQEVEYEDHLSQKSDNDGYLLTPSTLDVDPARTFQRKELLEQLQRAMEDLSEKHRTIVVLREVEGLSYAEIADTLEISKGTVMSRLHHARKNLQVALDSYLKGKLTID